MAARKQLSGIHFESIEKRVLMAAVTDVIASAIARVSDLSRYSTAALRAAREWAVTVDRSTNLSRLQHDLGAAKMVSAGLLDDVYRASFPASRTGQSIIRALSTFNPGQVSWPIIARQQAPRLIPNDPMFPNQWHLRNTGQGGGLVGADANITGTWDTYLGDGVVLGIVDDGVTPLHQDLAPNYNASLSWDFNNNDPDPSGGSHGTSVTGVAGAKGNNAVGVSGAAPNAQHAGLRLIAGPSSDAQEASALSWMMNDIDIYNNSWGPNDGGTTLEGPGPLTLAAFANAMQNGRNGLGNIWVWACGNGGNNDNVNFDGYANHRGIVSVAAITNTGVRSSYSERGASNLVAAYSNGGTLGITTTSSGGYTSGFGGTSSASPLAAGVIALMLDANPSLTWRDVQHVLVNSAEKVNPTDSDWIVNGAGHDVNHKYGFGGIDAAAATALATTWTTVAPEVTANTGTINVNQAIPNNNAAGVSHSVQVSESIKLETVEIVFNATHTSRGELQVILTSPSGTQSVLATERPDTGDNFNNWVFTTKRSWDENSAGIWTIRVIDDSGTAVGNFNSYKLNFYGTNAVAAPAVNGSQFVFDGATLPSPPHSLSYSFSQNVGASIDPSDLQLVNTTTNTTVPTANIAVSYNAGTNAATFTFPGYSDGVLPDGQYTATLLAAGVTNSGGTPLPANFVSNFFVLAGDADHNASVNLLDFNVLASNFGASGQIFSDGDFDYNGVVNLGDFNLLASRFGATLDAPGRGARSPADASRASVVRNGAIGASGELFGRRQIGILKADGQRSGISVLLDENTNEVLFA